MSLRLEAVPASVRLARQWVAHRAKESGGSPSAVHTLELVTSELVTNAVKYGPPDGTIEVEAARRGNVFDLTVSDQSHDPPLRLDVPPGNAGGHGVRLVQALAAEWDVELHAGDGKSVSFRLPV